MRVPCACHVCRVTCEGGREDREGRDGRGVAVRWGGWGGGGRGARGEERSHGPHAMLSVKFHATHAARAMTTASHRRHLLPSPRPPPIATASHRQHRLMSVLHAMCVSCVCHDFAVQVAYVPCHLCIPCVPCMLAAPRASDLHLTTNSGVQSAGACLPMLCVQCHECACHSCVRCHACHRGGRVE